MYAYQLRHQESTFPMKYYETHLNSLMSPKNTLRLSGFNHSLPRPNPDPKLKFPELFNFSLTWN